MGCTKQHVAESKTTNSSSIRMRGISIALWSFEITGMRRWSDKSLRLRGGFLSPIKDPQFAKTNTRFLGGFPDRISNTVCWRLNPFRGNLRELIENRTSHGFSGQIKCASLGSTQVSDHASIQVAQVVLCHTAARVSPVSAAGRIHLADQGDSAATPLASGQFSLHHCWQFARSHVATPA